VRPVDAEVSRRAALELWWLIRLLRIFFLHPSPRCLIMRYPFRSAKGIQTDMRVTFFLALGIGSLAAVSSSALADQVTYIYTGNDYTMADGLYSLSDYISASFTFSSPLPDNLALTTPLIVSWTITDGVVDLSSSSNFLSVEEFATNAAGRITQWIIGADELPGPPAQLGEYMQTFNSPVAFVEDYSTVDYTNNSAPVALNINDPGSWSLLQQSTPIPEPGTAALVWLGGVALLFRL
jgi:hypothetical protein